MLVLSRKLGERLVIGDNITVVVNRVAGNRVTLGIEAPSDVRIEFDGGSRVRSLCVDQGVRNHAFHARRDIAPKLDAILARAPGPRCLAHTARRRLRARREAARPLDEGRRPRLPGGPAPSLCQ